MAPAEAPSRAKWERWLDKLRTVILTLYLYRKFWRDFIAAAEAANVPPSYIFTFFQQTCAARQAVVVRSVCGRQGGQYSFHRLLTEIKDHPDLTENPTDPDDVEADLRSLDAGNLWRVRKYVDQYIAHIEETPVAAVPTFEDLHAAIDELGALLRKYMVLVLNEDQWLETSVAGDVMAPFRMAWLPKLPERPRRQPEPSPGED